MITVNEKLCSHCGSCVRVCPVDIFSLADSKEGPVAVTDESRCIACGHCLAVCPTRALENDYVVQKFNLDSEEPVIKASTEPVDFIGLLKRSHSIRNFKETVPPMADIEKIIETKAYTPSAANEHVVSVKVLEKGALYDQISEAADKYIGKYINMANTPVVRPVFEKVWPSFIEEMDALKALYECDDVGLKTGINRFTYEAPLLLIVHAPKTSTMGEIDAVLATNNMMHAAHSMGYGTLFLGFIQFCLTNSTKFHDALGIPKKNKVFAVISIGYPDIVYPWYLNKRPLQ